MKLQQKTMTCEHGLEPNWYQTTTFSTLSSLFFCSFKTFKVLFFLYPALKKEVSTFFFLPSVAWSLGLFFIPAPLSFFPACGASSCCCCPPALCSCSNEEPLPAASCSLSQSPVCSQRKFNQCVSFKKREQNEFACDCSLIEINMYFAIHQYFSSLDLFIGTNKI